MLGSDVLSDENQRATIPTKLEVDLAVIQGS